MIHRSSNTDAASGQTVVGSLIRMPCSKVCRLIPPIEWPVGSNKSMRLVLVRAVVSWFVNSMRSYWWGKGNGENLGCRQY